MQPSDFENLKVKELQAALKAGHPVEDPSELDDYEYRGVSPGL